MPVEDVMMAMRIFYLQYMGLNKLNIWVQTYLLLVLCMSKIKIQILKMKLSVVKVHTR